MLFLRARETFALAGRVIKPASNGRHSLAVRPSRGAGVAELSLSLRHQITGLLRPAILFPILATRPRACCGRQPP